MFIKKKTLDKLIRDAKNEVWGTVRQQDAEKRIWDEFRYVNNENSKHKTMIKTLIKRVDDLEEDIKELKGGKK